MKLILSVLAALVLMPFVTNAQSTPSPVHWQFSVKKVENDLYRFEAKATLDNGYHIWAQDPGGDGSLIPTSFTAEAVQGGWVGDWKENAQPKTQKLDFIDGAIHWHEKSIIFFRDFKGKHGDKIKGAVQYQTCNDKMCLPPAIENFVVPVN